MALDVDKVVAHLVEKYIRPQVAQLVDSKFDYEEDILCFEMTIGDEFDRDGEISFNIRTQIDLDQSDFIDEE